MVGTYSPLCFWKKMIKKETIERIVNQHLDGTDLFVVIITVTEKNDITIMVDGDRGVTVADCIILNRYVEQQLDRDTEDYSVEVSSYGVGNPLLMPRQYLKNTGRLLEVHLSDGSVHTGRIRSADDEGVDIETVASEKKGKEKKTESELINIKYNTIQRSLIQVEF